MDAVLASSMEFEEYIRRKREVNDSRNPLSILGSSMSNNSSSSSSSNRNQSKNKIRNQNTTTTTNDNDNLPPAPAYSSYSFKHSWSMHLNSNHHKENDNNSSHNHITPTKARWGTSQYDDHDILSLNGGRDGGRGGAAPKNYTKYSPYSVTEIPEPDNDNDYLSHKHEYKYHSNKSMHSKSEYEKHQYDKYIERYLGSNMEMDMVNSPSSSTYSPPTTFSPPRNDSSHSESQRKKPAPQSPERLVKEFHQRCNKQVLVRVFDRWRRCAWLDREAITNKEITLHNRHVGSVLGRAMKLWHQTYMVISHSNNNMYNKGLYSLFFNMHSCSSERENTHRAIHHHVRQCIERGMLALHRAVMAARVRTRKVVLNEIADRFRDKKILQCCWQGWNRWCNLQHDLKVIEDEREQRRHRIHLLVGTMKARNANPPAPPNTPVPPSDTVNHKSRTRTAKNNNRNNADSEQDESFPDSNSTTTNTTSSSSSISQRVRERSRQRLRMQNQSKKSESKLSQREREREQERDGHKDDHYDGDAKDHRQRPPLAEEKEKLSVNVDLDVADAKQHESKEVGSKDEMNNEGNDNNNDTNSKYRSLDDIPLEARLERQRFIRSRAEARVAKLRTKQQEDHRRKQEEADEALERERQDKYRERQEMKEKSDKNRRRLTEDEVVERKRMLNLATRFRRFQLLTRFGLGPWQRLLALRDESEDKAMRFRNDTLKERMWMALHAYCKSEKSSRIRREYAQSHLASVHFKKGILRRTLQAWLLYRRLLKAKAVAVSGHSSKFCVKKRAMKAWQVALQKAIRTETHKMRLYASRGDKISMKHYFSAWCKYHEEMILEREIQYRTDMTWKRVQAWLL